MAPQAMVIWNLPSMGPVNCSHGLVVWFDGDLPIVKFADESGDQTA